MFFQRFRLFVCVCLAFPFSASAHDAAPVREITQVRGDLYQAQEGAQATVFLVTPGGIVLADPLNASFARWLKSELAERFPGRAIRYVVCTGHRHERAAGAWALNDTADIVGHDAFESARRDAASAMPAMWAPFDRNNNAVLERSEAVAFGAEALAKDRNKDGKVTAAEVWGDVSIPETTYRSRHVIELGGRRVELVHPGGGLGADLTLILFPTERVLFAPGVPLHEVPSSFGPGSPTAVIRTLQRIEQLAFDTVISERGEASTLADLALVREYVEEMVEGVKAGVRAGDAVEQVQASLELERFRQLRNFDAQRGRNIAEAYRQLRLVTIGLSAAAQVVNVERGVPECAVNAPPTILLACEDVGGRTFAGTGGVSVMFGRLGGSVEYSTGGVLIGRAQRFSFDTISYEYREAATAFMFRYEAVRLDRLGIVLAGGLARVSATQRSDGPYGFYYQPYEMKTTAFAKVFGADFTAAIGPLRLIVPARITRAPRTLYAAVGSTAPKWDLRVGVGFAVPLARVVM